MSHINGIGRRGSFAMNKNPMDNVEVFVLTVAVADRRYMATAL
jgi:hypothetical protein